MEAFAIGDLHFDGPISRLVEHHEQFIVRELTKVANAARNKGVQNLILLGDTGHSPRMSYESQLAFLGWLKSVKDLSVHCILGNHDMFSENPDAGHSLQLIQKLGLKHFHLYTEPTVVKIEGQWVNFLPWPHKSFDPKFLNIAHIERRGSQSDSGRIFRSEELSDGKEYAVIGHLHTNQTVRNSFYPGTLYQTTFGESEKKYYAHIQYNGKRDLEIQYVRHKPDILLRTVIINSKADLAKIPKDPSILVRLVVADGVDLSKSRTLQYPNVVKVRGFATKEDLQSVVAEELSDGLDVKIKTYDFLRQYLRIHNISPEERKRAVRLWKSITRVQI